MRSLFANVRNMTFPSNAGPGTARLFIGPDLPPPLNSYVTVYGRFAAALIFYSQGSDDTYSYIGVIEDTQPDVTVVEWGHVVQGAVVEYAPGVPMGLSRLASPAGMSQNNYADAQFFNTAAGWNVSAGTQAQIGAALIALLSAPTVRLDATDTEITGALHWRTGSGGADAVTVSAAVAASGTTTSTTYVLALTGSTTCGVPFVAPPSGTVLVTVNAGLDNSTAGGTAWCAPEIRAGAVVGAGAVVAGYAAADGNSVALSGTDSPRYGVTVPVSGLTAGATYNVSTWQRTTAANTGTFANRTVTVTPAL